MRLDALLAGTDAGCEGLSFEYQPERWPRQDSLDGFISTFAERCAAKRFQQINARPLDEFRKRRDDHRRL